MTGVQTCALPIFRRVPVFEYGADGEPARITHWQERPVAKSLEEALLNGMDFYKQGRGWIRGGKKAERDYGYTPEPVEE